MKSALVTLSAIVKCVGHYFLIDGRKRSYPAMEIWEPGERLRQATLSVERGRGLFIVWDDGSCMPITLEEINDSELCIDGVLWKIVMFSEGALDAVARARSER